MKILPRYGRVVFARIGYMKYYRGPSDEDARPKKGGKYNESHVGSEAWNFLPVDLPPGRALFGYFQPTAIRRGRPYPTVNLDRIDSSATKPSILEDVLVVYVADQRIIGWYHAADMRRKPRFPMHHDSRGAAPYYCFTALANAVLLPEDRRTHVIPKAGRDRSGRKIAGMGQANICYVLDAEGLPKRDPWIASAIRFVKNYRGPNLLDAAVPEPKAGKRRKPSLAAPEAGLQHDPVLRRLIEGHAMKAATKAYKAKGYIVRDVSASESFDLECRKKGARPLRVEVKGTQGEGLSVELTQNEVESAKKSMTDLFILSGISVASANGKYSFRGGTARIISDWQVNEDGVLTPTSFRYALKARK